MIIVCERRINMHYITIPVWVFVIIVILAGLMTLIILLVIFGIIAALLTSGSENNGMDNYDADSYELGMELETKENETDQSQS